VIGRLLCALGYHDWQPAGAVIVVCVRKACRGNPRFLGGRL